MCFWHVAACLIRKNMQISIYSLEGFVSLPNERFRVEALSACGPDFLDKCCKNNNLAPQKYGQKYLVYCWDQKFHFRYSFFPDFSASTYSFWMNFEHETQQILLLLMIWNLTLRQLRTYHNNTWWATEF